MSTALQPTREEGLTRLRAFVPRAGSAYAKSRNFDLGPGDRSNVSLLSPFLRHRLVAEDEVVRAVLAKHPISAADKFVQEICWRTYWKGWLEQRPRVWSDFLSGLSQAQAKMEEDRDIARAYEQAINGKTGIAAFDAWAKELTETGYQHNHARMWFASVWIFTLKLPWTLGADFFYRHLLDGDAASNTLSWRWVAGLHTRGKHYVARADNIRQFTEGRFDPAGQLDEAPEPLDGPEPPAPTRLRPPMSVTQEEDLVLLLQEDDLTPERWPVAAERVKGVVLLPPDGSYRGLSAAVHAFRAGAMADTAARARIAFCAPVLSLAKPTPEEAVALCRAHGVEKLVTAQVPVGPARATYDSFVAELAGSGVAAVEVRRDWDSAFWPYARAGFFKVKERIPETLERLGLL
ncbi:MAG: FAD-binding domain-containing protein [Deltaproteobacteria bacterium]